MYLHMSIEVRLCVESVSTVITHKLLLGSVVRDMNDEIINSVVNLVTSCTCKLLRVVCCLTVSVDDMFMTFFHVLQEVNFGHVWSVAYFTGIQV